MEYHPDGGTTHALFTGSIHDTGYEYQPMAYWEVSIAVRQSHQFLHAFSGK